ncbi:SURF1 family protein [Elioraea tepidiphila]|jgi:surfeit locus 1 family protein|uniref:SURF1 family protein n=1 Tax=Elioraea tepidiphila TaxID=457934 RepID=UPI00036D4795|nr:SURF1 family protein [Elioraea tepidiphila]
MTATRPAWRVLLWPTLGAAVLLAVLLTLGTWQVQRLAWKNAWIAQLRAAEALPPEQLPARLDDPAPLAFRRFAVTGIYRHDLSFVLGVHERARRLGAFLVTPLVREQGDPVWVVRGWVPYEAPRAVPNPEGTVTVTGFLMLPERRGWFTPEDKPEERRFWAFQPDRMAEAAGLPRTTNFAIAAIGPGEEPPIPQRRPPMPRNDHLGYAITWYGLAFALVAFWIVWARRLLRDERSR